MIRSPRHILPWYHSTRTDSSFLCVSSHQARHARTRLSLFQSILWVSLRMIHNNTHTRPTRPSTAVRPSRQNPTCMCKAYPIDVYPGGTQRRGAQMPSPQLPLHPLWKPRYVSCLSTPPVSRLCLRGGYEETAEGLHSLWRLQVVASCKLPGTASIDCNKKHPAGTEAGAYL